MKSLEFSEPDARPELPGCRLIRAGIEQAGSAPLLTGSELMKDPLKAGDMGLSYLVVGGHAVNAYAEPRATLDVDLLG